MSYYYYYYYYYISCPSSVNNTFQHSHYKQYHTTCYVRLNSGIIIAISRHWCAVWILMEMSHLRFRIYNSRTGSLALRWMLAETLVTSCFCRCYYYNYYCYYYTICMSLSQAFLSGTSCEPAVIPTAQASSFTLQYFPYYV